ncbi:MAG: 50S ribosomal protein L25 [Tissierellia bacterium]|nr:50S ribosomal protein L25 [Tissierellia bacterium]
MSALKLQIERRAEVGKNTAKEVRKENKIPAVIYGKGEENIHVKVDLSEFLKVNRAAGTSAVLDLDLEGETIPVIIKEVQRHPLKDQILHVDFQKLNMHEKVRLTVPIVLLNRDSIKLQPSVLVQLLDQIEIECLPAHIPGAAQVDVQDMDFTTPITVGDLDIASNENITILRDLDDIVCTLTQPSAPAEEEAEEGEETEAPEATEASENQME